MYHRLSVVVIAIAVLMLSGCATVMDSGPDQVRVDSDPEGATIYMDGVNLGQTPTTVSLNRERSGMMRFEKEGYEELTIQVNKSFNGWIIGNICFGGAGTIAGGAIDVINNNHQKFEDQPVNVTLTPIEREEASETEARERESESVSLQLEPGDD